MENSIWYNEQISQIDSIIAAHSKAELSKFKIGWLIKLIRKVDEFQESCPTCLEFKTLVETIIVELDLLSKDPSKDKSNYAAQLSSIHTHLKTVHRVVLVRHYMHLGVIFGVILGLVITFSFMNSNSDIEKYGLWIGVIPGYLIGLYLDKKADSEGRVIS